MSPRQVEQYSFPSDPVNLWIALQVYGKEYRVALAAHRSSAIERDALKFEKEQNDGNLVAMKKAIELGEAKQPLRLDHIEAWHRKIFKYGGFRDGPVVISNSGKSPPEVHQMYMQLLALIKDINSALSNTTSPDGRFHAIARAHITFEGIHPFFDGNGRVGRCLINYMAAYWEMGVICIDPRHRERYFQLLENEDVHGLAELLRKSVL